MFTDFVSIPYQAWYTLDVAKDIIQYIKPQDMYITIHCCYTKIYH